MTKIQIFLARILFLAVMVALVILAMYAPRFRLLPPPPAPITPVTPIAVITITPPPPPLTSTPTIHPTRTLTPVAPTATETATEISITPTIENSPTHAPSSTPLTIATIVPGRVTLPTTGADPTQLFFMRALQPLGEIQFPFTLAEFLGYLAGGILTYPASKFIFEKLDEWFPDLFGLPKLSRAQKRFAAYPIAALIAVGATVLLHYLGYAPLTADSLYKAFGTAFLTAQALHGYFDLTGADPAQESKTALVNLFAAVKGFQFAHVDAKVVEQGEMRERYLELLNAAREAEKLLYAGAKKQ